jgi:hypothetical protein
LREQLDVFVMQRSQPSSLAQILFADGNNSIYQQSGNAAAGDCDSTLTGVAVVCCAVLRLRRYNPQDVGRASLLLGSGAILGRRFQAYEAHIPFMLQLKVWWFGAMCIVYALCIVYDSVVWQK